MTESIDDHIKYAESVIFCRKNRLFDSSIIVSHKKKRMSQFALVSYVSVGSKYYIAKVLLLFQHNHHHRTKNLALIQIYQNMTVSSSGIPFCDLNERSNLSEINECSILEVVEIDSLTIAIAAIKSNLVYMNRIYFFWPGMKRCNTEIDGYDYEWSIDFMD